MAIKTNKMNNDTYVSEAKYPTTCKVCGNKAETRIGACWNCVEAETIIAEGLDMYDKNLEGGDAPMTSSMGKLRLLIKKGWKK